MKLLLIHQNFPGQFKHLARHFAANPENQVVAICQDYAPGLNDAAYRQVAQRVYRPHRAPTPNVHHYLYNVESSVLNGQAVAKLAHTLQRQGFTPDVTLAHCGWGESLFLKDVFPDRPLINFAEFYYHATGVDADFDPEYPIEIDDHLRIRTRNAVPLLSLASCDYAVSPTKWQKSLFPKEFQSKITVLHEGIDTDAAVADASARLTLPNGKVIDAGMDIITFCARDLEPYRGFHVFMRALPEILVRHPRCQVVITGGDSVNYGARRRDGRSYREAMLDEVSIDRDRVHFLGSVPYDTYLKILQVSTAHVYLTVPFVLSWSLMEAMSAQCVVIASDTPPVREVIKDRKNGLLVDFFARDQLVAAVDEALTRSAKMQALGKQARKTIVKDYAMKDALANYEALFASAMGKVDDTPSARVFAKAS